MIPIKLVPISARGRRKIKQGLPENCFILDGPRAVQCFGGAAGIFVGVPVVDEKIPKAFAFKNRWILAIDDPDFTVEPRNADE